MANKNANLSNLLNEENVKKIKNVAEKAKDQLDTNNDGKVDLNEIKNAAKNIGNILKKSK